MQFNITGINQSLISGIEAYYAGVINFVMLHKLSHRPTDHIYFELTVHRSVNHSNHTTNSSV
jgi:hypothetical protein